MIWDQSLRPSLYLSKEEVVRYEMTKPITVPILLCGELGRVPGKTGHEHGEKSRLDSNVVHIYVDEGDAGSPGREERDDVPTPKECSGSDCMEERSHLRPHSVGCHCAVRNITGRAYWMQRWPERVHNA
jgi:hypothetical protein